VFFDAETVLYVLYKNTTASLVFTRYTFSSELLNAATISPPESCTQKMQSCAEFVAEVAQKN